jgi:hypothetical protein
MLRRYGIFPKQQNICDKNNTAERIQMDGSAVLITHLKAYVVYAFTS